MDFDELQRRLLEAIRTRVRGGVLTERRLAIQTGISQPHIHNVLKGKRIPSLRATNRLIQGANLGVFDLVEPGEVAGRYCTGCEFRERYREVAVISERLGPGRPMPVAIDPAGRYSFPAAVLEGVQDPVAARLGPDPSMDGQLRENDLLLLDRSLAARSRLRPGSLYIIRISGEGLVRRLALVRSDLLVLGGPGPRPGDGYQTVPLRGKAAHEVVEARVAWLSRSLDGS